MKFLDYIQRWLQIVGSSLQIGAIFALVIAFLMGLYVIFFVKKWRFKRVNSIGGEVKK